MQFLMQCLDYYRADPVNNNSYPTTAQGLLALQPYCAKVAADNTTWNTANPDAIAANPEVTRRTYANVPNKDFWGNALVYLCPGTTGDYDLISLGADGKVGGVDKDADISANAEGSLIATWFEYTPTNALDLAMTTNLPATKAEDMA
jgi:general secretion pathway protein G